MITINEQEAAGIQRVLQEIRVCSRTYSGYSDGKLLEMAAARFMVDLHGAMGLEEPTVEDWRSTVREIGGRPATRDEIRAAAEKFGASMGF